MLPDDLRGRLAEHGQEHVLSFWDQLTDGERKTLLAQLQSLDLAELRSLYTGNAQTQAVPPAEVIGPIPYIPHDHPERHTRRSRGEELLRRGEVAVLLVAGGQGSRLGFEHPKGMYAVGPVTRKPLFQIHAEKVLAVSRRYGSALPFLIMTSHATHDETVAFFEQHHFFGLPAQEVFFFQQGTMPALDVHSGKLLLESRGRLFMGPDGHGGTLTALAKSGLLGQMAARGIREVFYFQVDNPLVRIADAEFVGHHIEAKAEVSSKVIAKTGPKEKMGVLASINGRCGIVEYSDISDELAHATDETGRLRLWAGNPAIHLFSVDFLKRVTSTNSALPFHVARKKVPHVNEQGHAVEPKTENALKFERFIFDVLPAADRYTVVEALRADEFAPLKNATGADSPATVEQALCEQAAGWVTAAGGKVPRKADGTLAFPLEVSPLYALDAEEFRRKFDSATVIDGPTAWQ